MTAGVEADSIIYSQDSRAKLQSGVNKICSAVAVTLGPKGQNVIIERKGQFPTLTKDGVTVARAVELRDKFENMGAQIVKEAAGRTADVAGDGTTTTTVLISSLFNEGIKAISTSHDPAELKEGIETASREVVREIARISTKITSDEQMMQIATISANGEREIGSIILRALNKVGRDGVIVVEEAKGFATSLEFVEGMQMDRGYLSPYFITNQDKMTAELANCLILLTPKKLSSFKEMLSLLEKVTETSKSLLVIADDVEGEAMHGLITNHMKQTLRCVAIRAPGFGENRLQALEDIAVVVKGRVISSLADCRLEDLGSAKKVVVGRSRTMIVDGAGSKETIDNRANTLRNQLSAPELDAEDRDTIRDRLAKLSGGVAVLRVGGATESEMKERRDRVDDALSATQSAIAEGIVAGGGMALITASAVLDSMISDLSRSDSFRAGVWVVWKACRAPLFQIVKNTGKSAELVLEKLAEQQADVGYDAARGKFEHMAASGIIDPAKVVRAALENASSAAVGLLSVGCMISLESETLPANG